MNDASSQLEVRSGRTSGFTLFELLVVLTILVLLAAIVGPRVMGYLGRAKSDVARTQMSNIVTALELYYLDMGRYPTEAEGLVALVEAPAGDARQASAPASSWRGPYFQNDAGLNDPWGRPYLYAQLDGAERVEIRSLGRDGVPGGEGEDGDLTAQ